MGRKVGMRVGGKEGRWVGGKGVSGQEGRWEGG